MYLIFLRVRRRLQKKNEDPKKSLGPKGHIPFLHKEQYTYRDVAK